MEKEDGHIDDTVLGDGLALNRSSRAYYYHAHSVRLLRPTAVAPISLKQ